MNFINHITDEEKKILSRIDEDCKNLHVLIPPKVKLNLLVHDAQGVEIERHEMLSKSWVRNAYNCMFIMITGCPSNSGGTTYGAGALPVKDTAGTTRQNSGLFIQFAGTADYETKEGHVGPVGNADRGIVIGTGTTAESFEHTAMSAKISHGNSSGQMSYTAQNNTTLAYDSGTKKYTATARRIFNNNSGANIGVNEIGWIHSKIFAGGWATNLLMSRDLLGTTVNVPNGGQLTVDFVIEMVFPE